MFYLAKGQLAFGMNFQEFCALCDATNDFQEDYNQNHTEGECFATYLKEGCDALLEENSDIVESLI